MWRKRSYRKKLPQQPKDSQVCAFSLLISGLLAFNICVHALIFYAAGVDGVIRDHHPLALVLAVAEAGAEVSATVVATGMLTPCLNSLPPPPSFVFLKFKMLYQISFILYNRKKRL